MSEFVVITLFKQFLSEGYGTPLCRQKVREHTKLKAKYITKVIKNSDEAQAAIKARVKINHNSLRFLAGA